MEQYFNMSILGTLSGCVLAVCILVQNLKEVVDYTTKSLFKKSLPTKYLTFILSITLYSLITYFNNGLKSGEDVLLTILNSFIISGIACKSTETIMNKKGKSDSIEISEIIKNEVEKVKNDKDNILKM